MAAGVSPIVTYTKDPASILDYTIDWRRFLKDDLIASVVWTVPVGIANAGTIASASTTTIWLSGGVAGTSYSIYATITTVGGRIEKRTIKINVIEK